jgi:hypothetical protein
MMARAPYNLNIPNVTICSCSLNTQKYLNWFSKKKIKYIICTRPHIYTSISNDTTTTLFWLCTELKITLCVVIRCHVVFFFGIGNCRPWFYPICAEARVVLLELALYLVSEALNKNIYPTTQATRNKLMYVPIYTH